MKTRNTENAADTSARNPVTAFLQEKPSRKPDGHYTTHGNATSHPHTGNSKKSTPHQQERHTLAPLRTKNSSKKKTKKNEQPKGGNSSTDRRLLKQNPNREDQTRHRDNRTAGKKPESTRRANTGTRHKTYEGNLKGGRPIHSRKTTHCARAK